MQSLSELYWTWRQRMNHWVPALLRYRRDRTASLFWLVVGIFQAGHIYLSHVARKLPIRALKLSLTRRFRRLLDDDCFDARAYYEPTMRTLLRSAAQSGHIRLVIDCTTVGRVHLLMMVAVAYQRRTLPIAWSWVPIPKGSGRSTEQVQIALLRYVNAHLLTHTPVSLVVDNEFGGGELMKKLRDWDWGYVLRQRATTYFFHYGFHQYQDVSVAPGECFWLAEVEVSKAHMHMTNVLICQEPKHAEPWYLATNFVELEAALAAYRKRMWLEEMFANFKQHGFHLWHSRLETPVRLSRLTVLVCLLYLWLVSLGQYVIDHDLAGEVDRTDRWDLSIVCLGWDWVERRLALGDTIPRVTIGHLRFEKAASAPPQTKPVR